MVARPEVGGVRPTAIRKVVDLPAPFGPRKPVTRPGRAVKLTSSTAVNGPYFLLSASILITSTPWPSGRTRHIREIAETCTRPPWTSPQGCDRYGGVGGGVRAREADKARQVF